MNEWREFSASSNGDTWLLGHDPATNRGIVLHRGNPSSGGHETRTPVDAFLAKHPASPEREALLALVQGEEASSQPTEDTATPSMKLAEEYLRLGGTRRSKIDDNIVDTRKWEDEPAAAAEFWVKHIEPLNERDRQTVEVELPSIVDD